MKQNNMEQEVFLKLRTYGFKNLSDKNQNGLNFLMFCLKHNNLQKILISNVSEWDYLLQNTDLTNQVKPGDFNALMFSVIYSRSQKINWTEQQWNYLIQHTDVTQKTPDEWNAFMYTLKNYDSNPKFIIHKIWEKMSEEQKQETFQSVCNAYQKKELHEKDILFTIYDLHFQPQPSTKNYLIEKHHKILQMIENRDLFFQLNKDLSSQKNNISNLKAKL
jgi:hypothetical protein